MSVIKWSLIMAFASDGFGKIRREPPELVLTPFIDVMFVILIFLVLSTSFMQPTSLKLNLPESQTGSTEFQSKNPAIEIELDATGELRLGGKRLELENLEASLRALDLSSKQPVFLAADSHAEHGTVVAIMDRMRRAGISNFGIRTLTERVPSEAPAR